MENKTEKRIAGIGGQAVLEGVMMRGKTSMSLAVRAENGDILLDTERLNSRAPKLTKIPVLRGVINFFLMLVLSVKTLTKSAEVFASDEGEQLSNTAMGISVFIGLALSVVLFILLPSMVASGISFLVGTENALVLSIIEGIVRVVIFISYLLLTGLIKDIKRTYMYHGAEHKVINCYESGLALNTENVMRSSKKHNRCGTTFLFFVVVLSIIVFAFANWLSAVFGVKSTWWTRLLIRLVLLPLVAGLSYEMLKGLAVLPDNAFTRALRAPGLSLQSLTTKEPTEEMVIVAMTAFNAVLEMENNPDALTVSFKTVPFDKTMSELKSILKAKETENAESDWIVCSVLNIKRSELFTVKETTRLEYNKILAYAKKRVNSGMPLAYVLGNTEFYGESIIVTPAVLIPRPETELLTERAIDYINKLEGQSERAIDYINKLEGQSERAIDYNNKLEGQSERAIDYNNKLEGQSERAIDYNNKLEGQSEREKNSQVETEKLNNDEKRISKEKVLALDLCTGSGCIARAIAKNTEARVIASDISRQALSIAEQNCKGQNVELVLSDLTKDIFERLQIIGGETRVFDCIVSNPPYIPNPDLETLQDEVKKEPRIALDGGIDGLDFYRRIAVECPLILKDGGKMFLEVGLGQSKIVRDMLADKFFVNIIKDYSGIDRILECTLIETVEKPKSNENEKQA